MLVPSQGFVAAADLTRALAAAARRHGAQLIEHGRVARISSSDGDLVVDTNHGSLIGDSVVVAAGSWSGQIEIEGVAARLPVRPVRGQLLQLAWNGPLLGRVIWSDRCIWFRGRTYASRRATVEEAGFATRDNGRRARLDRGCLRLVRTPGTPLRRRESRLAARERDELP